MQKAILLFIILGVFTNSTYGAENDRISVFDWSKNLEEAQLAVLDHDIDKALELFEKALDSGSELKPGEYLVTVTSMMQEFDKKKDLAGAESLISRELEREEAKPASQDGKVRRAFLYLTRSELSMKKNLVTDAISQINSAKMLAVGTEFEVPVQTLAYHFLAIIDLARKNFGEARKKLNEAARNCESALGARSDVKAAAMEEPTRAMTFRGYANIIVFLASLDRINHDLPGGISRLEKAAKMIERISSRKNPVLVDLFVVAAQYQFLRNSQKKAQLTVDRLIEVASVQKFVPGSVVSAVYLAASRAATAKDFQLMSKRFAELIRLCQLNKTGVDLLAREAVSVIDVVGEGDWKKTQRLQRDVLNQIYQRYPSQRSQAAPFLNAFAEKARSLQQIDDAVAYYREAVKELEGSLEPVVQIGALSHLERILVEQNRSGEALPVSERLVQALRQQYGDDSRVADAMNENASLLRKLNREEEAKKLEADAALIYGKAMLK